MADLQPYIDNFFAVGSKETTDEAKRELLERLVGVEAQYFDETQKAQARENIGITGGGVIVEKFIELSDCPSNYADRYALISDLENEQIIYSTVHGAAPKWFFVDQGCPNPSWDPEILVNGDFSEGDTGWTVPAGWSTASGAAVHTPGSTGVLTQEVEGSTLSGTYKLEIVTSGITAGTITVTMHDAATEAQLGETYTIGASNQGAGLCLFELAARDNYLVKITPSTTFDGTVDDCSFKKGDLNSSVPQIRGYTFNHTNVSPFEVAWRNNDLYIGRNAGWHGGLGVGGVVAVTPDGMATITGGYNITALGHSAGNGITNEHDLILIGTGVTVSAEQSNWLKIGIGSTEILEGDLSTLDLYARGNLEVSRNLILWAGNGYDYTFPDQATLNIGRFMYVNKATPAGELKWSVYSLPTSLPAASSVPLISEAGVGTWLAESSIAKWGTLTSGYVPYYNGSALADSGLSWDGIDKLSLNSTQIVRMPDQTTFAGSLIIGNGGNNLTYTAGEHGKYNTFVGLLAGYKNTTGYQNVFTGYAAGRTNTTGYANVFTGYTAGYSNTTGYQNVFTGYATGRFNTTGYANVFTGYTAGYSNTTGYLNVFTGYGAGYANTTGFYNVFTGYAAGYANTTGYINVFTGHTAGYSNTTGYSNVFTGYAAGRYITDGSTPNQTSTYSIFIGSGTKALSDGNTNQIVIGSGATGKGSNTVVIGNESIVETYLTGIRLKAGTSTASTSPLKFTSGTLLTAPEAGAVEFLTDRFYGTITTGAARKQFAFLEDNLNLFSSGTATSGQVPQANGSGGITWAAAAAGCKWVYDAVEQDLTYTETLGYGHVGINVTDPLFCLDIEESFRVDDGRGFHFRFDMQGAFIIQPATYIRNSSLFEIQQLHATESGRLLVMKQHAEGDYLSLWKYNGSTYVQKFKINHLGVMTSSGVTYPSAVPSSNGQSIVGNTDGSTSWATVTGLPSGTNGDILYYNSGWQKLAKGTAGHYLKQGSSIPEWAAVTASQWTTDTNGITYANNVGIGSASNTSFKLNVVADVAAYAMRIINKSGGGLLSVSNAATGYMYGLVGETNSDNGSAVYGNAKGDAIGVLGVSAGGTGVYGRGVSWGGHFKGGVRIETGGLTFGSTEVIASTRIANLVSLKIGGTEVIASTRIANLVGLNIGGTERISSAGVFTPSNGFSGTGNYTSFTILNGIITTAS